MYSQREWLAAECAVFQDANYAQWTSLSTQQRKQKLLYYLVEERGYPYENVLLWLNYFPDEYAQPQEENSEGRQTVRLNSAEIAPGITLTPDPNFLRMGGSVQVETRANLPQPIPQRSLTTDDWEQVAYLDAQVPYLGRKLPGCGFLAFWTVYFLVAFATGIGSNFLGAALLFLGVLCMIGWLKNDRRQAANRNPY